MRSGTIAYIRCRVLYLWLCFMAVGTDCVWAFQRIVSLAPSSTRALYQLGLEDRVVGVTIFCPMGSTKKERVGTLLEPSIERIVSLSPDLVVATKEGNRFATVARLQQLGISVYIMDSANSFSDICFEFTRLGKFMQVEKKARAIVEAAQMRVRNLQSTASRFPAITVFLEVGARPLFTVSRGCFLNDTIEFAGGINVFKEAKSRYPQISREEVLRKNPDVILLLVMGDVSLSETTVWSKFAELKAVKKNRIHVLVDSIFTEPSPLAVAESAEKLREWLTAGKKGIAK